MNLDFYHAISSELKQQDITLVAVSKRQPMNAIQELYDLGHRDFGENQVQELLSKQEQLPKDIRWHMIGHLQRNKVKSIIPFVHLIHAVDSYRLYEKICLEATQENRKVPILLQLKIAQEETKYGFDGHEIKELVKTYNQMENPPVIIKGLMAMASNTSDEKQVREEFEELIHLFEELNTMITNHEAPSIKSIGMSSDYPIAQSVGGNMLRIGSKIFGQRQY